MEIPTFKNIAELHEYVFQLLLEEHKKDNTFLFTLRIPQHFRENLAGHWFYGKEDYLYFSFWKSSDTVSNMPYIYYYVNLRGACLLILKSSGSEYTPHRLFAVIAPNIKDIITYGGVHSEKRYNSILALDDIKRDKQTIDKLINELLESRTIKPQLPALNISFISALEFESNLQNIQKLRKNRLIQRELQENEHFHLSNVTLNQFSITNITHFHKLDLTFAKRITCIIGENGSGKSTILRAIALALVGTDKKRINTQHKNIVSLLQIKGQQDGIEDYELEGKIELFYNAQYRNEISFSFEYGDLSITQNGDFKNIDTYYFPHLMLGFSQSQGKNENGHAISIIKNDKANIKDIRPLIYGESDNRFEEFGHWISNLFAEGNKKAREKSKEHQIIAQLFGIISTVIGAEVKFITVNHDEEKVWVATPDAPNGISLDLLSQGYSNVFGWIGYFMKRLAEVNPHAEDFMQCPAIVFIDEIDTYLHPKWQQSILSTLITTFPNIQFVVTTHSPLVITNLPLLHENDVKIYQIKNNEIEAVEVVGRDISSALWDYFGVPRRQMYFQTRINEVFALLEQEPLDILKIQAEIAQLKKLLGENDPDVQSIEGILENLQMLQNL